MGGHVSECFGLSTPRNFSNNNSARDDRQVSRELTIPSETPQHSKVVGQQSDKHFGTQVVNVID